MVLDKLNGLALLHAHKEIKLDLPQVLGEQRAHEQGGQRTWFPQQPSSTDPHFQTIKNKRNGNSPSIMTRKEGLLPEASTHGSMLSITKTCRKGELATGQTSKQPKHLSLQQDRLEQPMLQRLGLGQL